MIRKDNGGLVVFYNVVAGMKVVRQLLEKKDSLEP